MPFVMSRESYSPLLSRQVFSRSVSGVSSERSEVRVRWIIVRNLFMSPWVAFQALSAALVENPRQLIYSMAFGFLSSVATGFDTTVGYGECPEK